MTISKSLLLVAAAGLLSSTAFASSNNGSPLKELVQPSFSLKVKSEAFVQGNANSATLTAGYNNVDSGTTLNCTRVCTVSATASIQYEAGTTGTQWAICIFVDGVSAECQYQREEPYTFFDVGNIQTAVPSLAIGHHTVQTQVYVTNNSTLQYYAMTYAVHQ
jgi:hypothetical protein